jgi:hypothetical protein
MPGTSESESLLATLNVEKRVRSKASNPNAGMEMLPFGEPEL